MIYKFVFSFQILILYTTNNEDSHHYRFNGMRIHTQYKPNKKLHFADVNTNTSKHLPNKSSQYQKYNNKYVLNSDVNQSNGILSCFKTYGDSLLSALNLSKDKHKKNNKIFSNINPPNKNSPKEPPIQTPVYKVESNKKSKTIQYSDKNNRKKSIYELPVKIPNNKRNLECYTGNSSIEEFNNALNKVRNNQKGIDNANMFYNFEGKLLNKEKLLNKYEKCDKIVNDLKKSLESIITSLSYILDYFKTLDYNSFLSIILKHQGITQSDIEVYIEEHKNDKCYFIDLKRIKKSGKKCYRITKKWISIKNNKVSKLNENKINDFETLKRLLTKYNNNKERIINKINLIEFHTIDEGENASKELLKWVNSWKDFVEGINDTQILSFYEQYNENNCEDNIRDFKNIKRIKKSFVNDIETYKHKLKQNGYDDNLINDMHLVVTGKNIEEEFKTMN